MKAVVLFSGGLDSILAACTLKQQGVEVIGLNVITPFHDCSKEAAERAEEIGIELHTRTFGEEYMETFAHPKYGYGSNLNPCMECRALMCVEARKFMEEIGADFVATGEIAGQRPNSQKIHQLALIARESGLQGKLLRPLSAKVLPRTEMEIEGKIDREKLRSYTGRSRIKLIQYARSAFGIKNIPQPSSGCVLTENSYAPKLKDLLKYKEHPTIWDGKVVAWGRRIRIDENAYCVIARRLTDCNALMELYNSPKRSRCVLVYPENYMGASVLLVTDEAPEYGVEDPQISDKLAKYIETAGSLALRFTNPDKFAGCEGGPMGRIYIGATTKNIPIHVDPEVDKLELIMEANNPPKVKEPKPEDVENAEQAQDVADAAQNEPNAET